MAASVGAGVYLGRRITMFGKSAGRCLVGRWEVGEGLGGRGHVARSRDEGGAVGGGA